MNPNRHAKAMMRSMKARRCTYRAPGDPVGVSAKAVLDDSAAEIRVLSKREILGDGPEATVLESLGVTEGGTLDFNGTVYRIEQITDNAAPGLSDLLLTRVSGPALDEVDLSRGIVRALRETVVLDGREVRAAVTRRSTNLEHDAYGQQTRVTRTRVAVRNADLQGSGQGSSILLNGKTLRVARVLRTGAGLTELVC